MLLDCGKRLPHSGPESAGDLAQGIQDVFFSGGLHLLLIEDVAGAAVLGAQAQDVLASEPGNRAIQDRGTGGSLADVARERLESASRRPVGPSDPAFPGRARRRRG